jgi:hypothetical protein
MADFKLTNEILNNQWVDNTTTCTTPPITEYWHNLREPSIADVSIWEVIYHQPGNIGIYSAYCPYTEFYIIVYELFLNTDCGIVSYYGPDAARDVWKTAENLNIKLPITQIWTNNINLENNLNL